ncbi:membrane protein YpdK [Erwinia tracheiphila]
MKYALMGISFILLVLAQT